MGTLVDKKVIRAGKIKFISPGGCSIKLKPGLINGDIKLFYLIGFLPGTRSVISFFAGLSELRFWKTIILASISAASMECYNNLSGNNFWQ
jgi:hypothetical protein